MCFRFLSEVTFYVICALKMKNLEPILVSSAYSFHGTPFGGLVETLHIL